MKNHETQQKVKRPPVIVVMGHIDHGKSTLLDFVRKSNVAEKETGGITQHVGAYEASFKDKTGAEHHLTFIDTPGHEAFSTIRERGTRAADIAILVVSGEDGVKPQTLDALSCIKKSDIPFVIAITKTDRPGADVERIKANLAENEIYVEGYGGDVPFVPVSSVSGEGIPELLEMLVLVAEMHELTANEKQTATGVIIEAHIDAKRGTTATLIVRNGTLKTGTFLVAGNSFTPVRAIENFAGKQIKSAPPSSPVIIVGWSKLPKAGSTFKTVDSKKDAEAEVASCAEKKGCAEAWTPEDENQKTNTAVIPLVIKADAAGSLDAVIHEIEKIKVEGVSFKILLSGVGTVAENDVKTALSGKGSAILSFNTKVDASAKAVAERAGIPIQSFDIIYRLTEWLQAESEKRRPRVEVEEETGRAKVLKLFSSDKSKYVIGGRVEIGTLKSGAVVKILRRDEEIATGRIRSLQQQKVKADEIGKDSEFGAMIESKIEPAIGDRLISFIVSVK